MPGYFTVLSKKKIGEMNIGDRIEESDFSTLTPEGDFVQLKYHDEPEKSTPYTVKPGVYTIQDNISRMVLKETSFTEDKILDSFIHTEDISSKINCFFNNFQVYKELGFEVPKRAILLYGPAGSGKSTCINKTIKTYSNDNKTAIISWSTDKHEAYEVKRFIKTFEYAGVEKLIFIAEDIGGIELSEVRQPSDSSLLSLLDNQEKIFKIPVLILATTNFPETFLGNLTNRPQRFDDKIKVGFPPAEFRTKFLEFFSQESLTSEIDSLLKSDKCKEFTPAHIKEVVIRSKIYSKDMLSVIKEIIEEIERYNKGFQDGGRVGITW